MIAAEKGKKKDRESNGKYRALEVRDGVICRSMKRKSGIPCVGYTWAVCVSRFGVYLGSVVCSRVWGIPWQCVFPCVGYTLTDGVVGGATHVEPGITAAVLGVVHLGAARLAAEGRVVHHAPLGWGCKRGGRQERRIYLTLLPWDNNTNTNTNTHHTAGNPYPKHRGTHSRGTGSHCQLKDEHIWEWC